MLVSNPAIHETSHTSFLQWPGYTPWHSVFHVYDHAYEAKGITLARLAYEVARAVKQFKEVISTQFAVESNADNRNMQDVSGTASTEQGWSVNHIDLEDLFLLELRHVSTGSWQPVLIWRVKQ